MTQLGADPLADARPGSYWHDLHGVGPTTEPLVGDTAADVLVVGGGFTGLWTAITVKRRHPEQDVVLVESEHVGHGATGRNGGFVSESLTHGLSHGLALWPDQVDDLLALGRTNLRGLAVDLDEQGIAAELRLTGKTVVATTPHDAAALGPLAELMTAHGEDVSVLDAAGVRADVDSPTYLAGLRVRSGGGLLDPIALAHGLRDWATRLGVRLHERTPVVSVAPGVATTTTGRVRARRIVLATNAYPAPMRRLRKFVVPVYDHVLVTEPLSDSQWAGLGWAERQGLTDAGNQFHYYRPLPDGRILWGGYDAIYYFGSSTSAAHEQRDASHRLLAEQFVETFPQLDGIRFTHRWAGLIDTTSRFVPYLGLDRSGSIAHAVGFTGLGVAYSRFAAGAVADLLDGGSAPAFLTKAPVPFPPEPLRYVAVQTTRAALAREDVTGRRGAWLRLLDRFGVGFNS
jgi:glycine/D-amino acid oxidase-like deaminating enzyme